MTALGDNTSEVHGAPLAGRSVVVTRSMEQSADLARPLEALGATVVACPVIDIVDPPEPQLVEQAISRLSTYDWVVLTSTNAVDRFFGHGAFAGDPAAAITAAGVRVAAVGRATADRLAQLGIAVDLVPADYRAEGLAEAFVDMEAGEGWRFLIPRALEAREVLRDTLEPLGAVVDVVPVYRTIPATPAPQVAARLASGDFDVVTFTSPSTVRNFIAMLLAGGLDPSAVLSDVVRASIGPVTTAALAEAGFEPTVEADPSTVPVLVDAIAEWFSASDAG